MDARFRTHVFISYTHIDNLRTPDDDGWVTRFHGYLQTFLSKRLGQKANIYWDDKLRGNDIFSAKLLKELPETAILLSILSPRYLESTWCLKEVEEFCKAAEKNVGLTVDDKSRVLRAMLQGVPSEERNNLPDILKNALGYEFFQKKGERELPLDPTFGNGIEYRQQVYFLAEDISTLLRKLEALVTEAVATDQGQPQATVYLAECGYDMREAREKMRGELRGLNYKVIPDQLARTPDSEAEYVTGVSSLLEQCSLSIHIVGQSPGKVLDGPGHKSVTVLQNEVAATASAERALPRIIWLPEGASSNFPEHDAFIQAVQTEASLQNGADLVRSDFEALKRVVYSSLEKLKQPTPAAVPKPTKLVYVICDSKDRQNCRPLRLYLRRHGFEEQIPAFEGDAKAVREANDRLLATCDAVLVYYGDGEEPWKRAIDNELLRMRGYRRAPLRASFTYLATPVTDDKKDLIELDEPGLIEGFDGFTEDSLQPLVELLKA